MYILFYSLVFSEMPVLIFTILDICKFPSLQIYRITYDSHPIRPYPSNSQLYKAATDYLSITLCVLFPLSYLGETILVYTQCNIFNTTRETLIIYDAVGELFAMFIWSDVLFYGMHRMLHIPKYYHLHKKHHSYVYDSFSLVNHCLDPLEMVLFMMPPLFSAILLHPHIYVMCAYIFIANTMGTYIHSGYCFPMVNRILLVDPRDHDRHHVKKVTNYGLGTFFSLTDRLFGSLGRTYLVAV